MHCPQLFEDTNKPRHILCLGAHCDDIEIGCGGSLISILERFLNIDVSWIIFTSNEQRKNEAEVGAQLFTQKAKARQVQIFEFRDGFLPFSGTEVKDTFEQIKKDVPAPDLIFTHYRNDLHQDHRIVSDLTWNTFRNHMILEYEIPKWDGDMGSPNSFIHLSNDVGKQKISFLQQAYNTQQSKNWFTDDLFWSLMRIRGMESNSPSGIAEAFYSRKAIFNL